MTKGEWDNETVYDMIDTIEELLEVARDVLDYSRGQGDYDFYKLPEQERANAPFDAWQDIEQRLEIAIANATGGKL